MINDGEKDRRARIVVDQFGGIIPQNEAFYLSAIVYSASRSLLAFDRFKAISLYQSPDEGVSTIQEAISHSSGLSRIFWPSPGGRKSTLVQNDLREARGAKLRVAFNMTDSSPLQDRTIRNALEHFDERLDSYLLENDAGYFFPTSIIGEHTLADDPTGNIFRLLDPESRCLVVMGEKYFFATLIPEVQRVLTAAQQFQFKGDRLP